MGSRTRNSTRARKRAASDQTKHDRFTGRPFQLRVHLHGVYHRFPLVTPQTAKGCPFCGSCDTDVIVFFEKDDEHPAGKSVKAFASCDHCGASVEDGEFNKTDVDYEALAIEVSTRWNRRRGSK